MKKNKPVTVDVLPEQLDVLPGPLEVSPEFIEALLISFTEYLAAFHLDRGRVQYMNPEMFMRDHVRPFIRLARERSWDLKLALADPDPENLRKLVASAVGSARLTVLAAIAGLALILAGCAALAGPIAGAVALSVYQALESPSPTSSPEKLEEPVDPKDAAPEIQFGPGAEGQEFKSLEDI